MIFLFILFLIPSSNIVCLLAHQKTRERFVPFSSIRQPFGRKEYFAHSFSVFIPDMACSEAVRIIDGSILGNPVLENGELVVKMETSTQGKMSLKPEPCSHNLNHQSPTLTPKRGAGGHAEQIYIGQKCLKCHLYSQFIP